MKPFINIFTSGVVKNHRIILVLSVILVATALLVLPRIKIDNSVDVFFDKKSPSYIDFQSWKEQFGSDQIILVALHDLDIFTQGTLTLIQHLSREFEALDHVDSVTSITTVNDIIGKRDDFIVEPFIDTVPSSPTELKALKNRALVNPLYVKSLISPDAKTAALAIELEHVSNADDAYKREVIENVSAILKKEIRPPRQYFISGFTAIEFFYASYMQDDLKTFMPFMLLIIIAILYLSFRSIAGILLPLSSVITSLILTLGVLYACGFSINNVTTIIPPIMLAIAIADSIHLLSESIQRQRVRTGGGEISLESVLDKLFVPCFLTSATTAVGFFSLTVSRIPPVKELGLVVGFGVLLAFFVTFTLLPALIRQFNLFGRSSGRLPKGENLFGEWFDILLARLAAVTIRFRNAILVLLLVLVGFSLVGLFKIKVETSVLEYFKKQSPIYQATDFVEKHLSGVHFLNISLKADTQDYFKDPGALGEIEKLQNFLGRIPEVDVTTSVVDYIKEINKSFHDEDGRFYILPSSSELIAQYLLLYGADDLDDFVDSRWSWTTVEVRLKEHSTVRLDEIIGNIRQYLDAHFTREAKAQVLGQTVLEVETNNAVTSGQIQSLGLAMIVIFAMMFFVFRSVPVGLVSVVPNLLPLLVNFGIMGWLGIRLDSATSMISAVGIGIIVDDTIHFLHAFGKNIKETDDYPKAVIATLRDKGRPIVLTSVILFCGFGVVGFSRFVPTSSFGLLSALLMFNALVADLMVLPAVLLLVKPKFKG